ncbi:uncharacterized protein LOC121422157 isoform X2 [Lytechinus variegatus]|uniref:uncharacterized protein LOC121422157 isoform X2 n=1 Tax=Lytechinus variegatus TaxID=7654 RepID=UPI001BB10E8C|nr:uncharacterized protein LOC121422157 isoform X2 [Lytechinus variegatus]
MNLGFSLKAVGITLLAVIIALAFADNPRQVQKKPMYRGWTKMTESRYGPTVRDNGQSNIQTRAWNSRTRVGKRFVPELDSFVKRPAWSPRPPVGEINDAFEDEQLIDDAALDLHPGENDDVLREIMDYVKREGRQK